MYDQLVTLLHRQATALEAVESRLRALELLVVADEERFLVQAMEDLEQAAERLAALELGRTLVLATAGLPVDASATELAGAVDPDTHALFTDVVVRLRTATNGVADARARAAAVLGAAAEDVRQRLAAAEAAVIV
ncbi:hypothetical protein [Egicoccus halophilus]|uniref:FlgN protein n=1 Tax=Egicoccus halophilus TaxID=1670830 RepID=A0A8J3A8A3_9ACTN|nr:hypothetical protein [Egicoccus halophilus]GGI06658.1 hypothetical protein GCM10011354_20190 [Egicoccus halophilus]